MALGPEYVWYQQEVINLGVPMVKRPPYIFYRGSVITIHRTNTITNKNPAPAAALLML
jgi:hypothetical protein